MCKTKEKKERSTPTGTKRRNRDASDNEKARGHGKKGGSWRDQAEPQETQLATFENNNFYDQNDNQQYQKRPNGDNDVGKRGGRRDRNGSFKYNNRTLSARVNVSNIKEIIYGLF